MELKVFRLKIKETHSFADQLWTHTSHPAKCFSPLVRQQALISVRGAPASLPRPAAGFLTANDRTSPLPHGLCSALLF